MAAGQLSEKELGRIILMQLMFAARNIRAQRERLVDFQYQLQETPTGEVIPGFDKVSTWNRMLLCKYNLHHDTGDPVEDILLGFDEVSLDDRHLEPELELQQTAGEAIEHWLGRAIGDAGALL
jgi:hypothetical protein